MYKINRVAIRQALKDYLQAKKEFETIHDQILNDEEIQNLYDREMIREARQLTRKKYPSYSYLKSLTYEKAIKLIQTMIVGIPDFEGIEPEKIYKNVTRFEELVNLAKLV